MSFADAHDRDHPPETGRRAEHRIRPLLSPHGASPKMLPMAYEDVRKSLRTGFLALCRPGSLEGQLITEDTRDNGAPAWQRYSHATMLGWCGNVLMLGETRQHRDARLISAKEEFRLWPGYYDIYRIEAWSYRPDQAWESMLRAAGTGYGYNHISRVFLRRLLGDRIPPIPNSDSPRWPRDCSALVHAVVRTSRGGRVADFDCDVTPQSLCRSDYATYLYTIASVAKDGE